MSSVALVLAGVFLMWLSTNFADMATRGYFLKYREAIVACVLLLAGLSLFALGVVRAVFA